MASGISKRLSNLIRIVRYGSFKDNLSLIRYKFGKTKSVTLRRKGNKKWAYISYIPEALVRSDSHFLNRHQAYREMKVIAESFLENGYNIDVQDYHATCLPTRKYDLVFGLQPKFTECAKKNPRATKIFYGTGAYSEFANSQIILRTKEFNIKHNTNIPARRLVEEDECVELSDKILQIGTVNTIETYPEHIRDKITLIHQSTNFLINIPVTDKGYNQKKFLWLGSGGSILKGADLIIETFLQHPELEIDLVGPIDPEIFDAFGEALASAPNIRFQGFIDVNSQRFLEIVSDTTFMLYPSATEGGCPGAVLVTQKLGLIPILSKVSSPKEIADLGYMLEDVSAESIDKALEWSQNLNDDEINIFKSKNLEFSKQYSLDNFRREFNDYLKSVD